MKKLLPVLTLLFAFANFSAQSKADIAKVYVKRSKESFKSEKLAESLEYFEKALKYIDTITDTEVADLGMRIYLKKNDYKKAQTYAKQYFAVENQKKSSLYLENLDLYVTISEKLEEQLEAERKRQAELLKKAKELARIDSLKAVWKAKSIDLSIKADSLYAYNKNGIALFETKKGFGIIDDKGTIILEPKEYKFGLASGGYILLMNKKVNPTKIYSYNSNTKEGSLLPKVVEFSATSTNYGQVMPPRENGVLVTYPNNALKTFVYDLNGKTFLVVPDEKEIFKTLKKRDVIERYNSDSQLRIGGEYYNFGGHLGGGIFSLYKDDFSVFGYLFSVSGNVLSVSEYEVLGAFYNETLQAKKGEKMFWLDQNAQPITAPEIKASIYEGLSKVSKLGNGNYQISREGIIINGDKTLVKMDDYIKANTPN